MALDPTRAALVKQEYRSITQTAPAAKARNDSAREVELDTNLDLTGASALALKYLAENANPRVFEVTLEGVIHIDAFIGGPPRFIPNFPRESTDGRAMKVIGAMVDYGRGQTVVRMRG